MNILYNLINNVKKKEGAHDPLSP